MAQFVQFFFSNMDFHFSYLFPVINLEGPQLEFSRLISWMKFETKEDYEKYFSRLSFFPTQVKQCCTVYQGI